MRPRISTRGSVCLSGCRSACPSVCLSVRPSFHIKCINFHGKQLLLTWKTIRLSSSSLPPLPPLPPPPLSLLPPLPPPPPPASFASTAMAAATAKKYFLNFQPLLIKNIIRPSSSPLPPPLLLPRHHHCHCRHHIRVHIQSLIAISRVCVRVWIASSQPCARWIGTHSLNLFPLSLGASERASERANEHSGACK